MKQEKQIYDDPNCIEQKARELFGYDEKTLLAEMDEAERAWEAEKSANPDAAANAKRDADKGFEKLMANINAKGIQPVSEAEYESEERKNNRKVVMIGRKKKKVMLLAAAVCVLGIGSTMVVSARRELKYNLYPVQGKQNVLVKKNAVIRMGEKKLDDAYIEIEDMLGIKALKLGHIPVGMKFKQSIIEEKHVVIELEYGGMSIYLKEAINPESSGALQAKASDRKACEEAYNDWLNQEMVIEENVLQSGLAEYSTYLNGDNSCYTLSGIMEKDEFVELAKGLYY